MTLSLTDYEIEAKIDAAVRAELAKGKKAGDMGRRDFEAIARMVEPIMSPAAREKTIRHGLQHMVEAIFGEMLAEKLWLSGRGYGATDDELIGLAREMRFEPAASAPDWLDNYRVDISDCDLTRLDATYKSAARFRRLIVGEPAGALLGEVAIRKASIGDPLALAFLSGCEGAGS